MTTKVVPDIELATNRTFVLKENGVVAKGGENSTMRRDEAKKSMDEAKNRLHQICKDDESLRKWRIHSQRMHILHEAPKVLRKQLDCPTSQAFCKFQEILINFPSIVRGRHTFRSFHLCEAPGHFVTALDRFICVFHPNVNWQWRANSLNPHSEVLSPADMFLDDDLIVAHPNNWVFGYDNTGDIMKISDACWKSARKGGGFDLVTADGSIYAQDDPENQEQHVAPLLAQEVSIALKLLKDGGSLVVKFYSTFTDNMANIVKTLLERFDSVTIFKPMCSKIGNSERYIVCQGFRKKIPRVDTNSNFKEIIEESEIFFTNLQTYGINLNMTAYGNTCEMFKCLLNGYNCRMKHRFFGNPSIKALEKPIRQSYLNLEVENPWKQLFGHNYVERLKNLSNTERAKEFLRELNKKNLLSVIDEHEMEKEDLEPILVEWAPEELEFINDSRFLKTNIFWCEPSTSLEKCSHSLFTDPMVFQAFQQIGSHIIQDICLESHQSRPFAEVIENLSKDEECDITLEVDENHSYRDWIDLLPVICKYSQNIRNLVITWKRQTTPLILSRFSASVLSILTIIFSNFKFMEGNVIATFHDPNYPEDIPPQLLHFLLDLQHSNKHFVQYVPYKMISTIHSEIVTFNERQLKKVLEKNSSLYCE